MAKKVFEKYKHKVPMLSLSNAFDEDDLRDVILNQIYKSDNLSEKQSNQLIDQTTIEIEIIHPKIEKSIKCKGKITQLILN